MKKIILSIACFAFIYNLNAQLLESYTLENWTEEEWQFTSRDLYFYDGSGNQNQYEYQQYDITNSTWSPYFRDTIYLDINARKDSVISSIYSSSTMQWAPFSKGTYEYSPEGYFTSYLVENYSGSETVPSSLTTRQYDDNGFLSQYIYNVWNAGTVDWRGLSRYDYINNAEGLVDTTLAYIFFADLQDWAQSQRTVHVYSTSGMVLETVTELFEDNVWINYTRDFFEYDGSDYLIERRREAWDAEEGTWNYSQKTEYTNTALGNMDQTLSTFWDGSDSTWTNSQRGNYVYSGPAGLKMNQIAETVLFPNPADGFIKILKAENAQITIINSTGSIVDVVNSYEGESIKTDAYKSGIYTVIIHNENETKVSRFIKK